MSTIYVFDDELSALATPASGDKLLVSDVSTGTKKTVTCGELIGLIRGEATTDTVGFYGVTAVNQGTFTATALTAIGTTTLSVAFTGIFGFASSTAGNALITRVDQMQVDLQLLMARIDSTGLLAIAGV